MNKKEKVTLGIAVSAALAANVNPLLLNPLEAEPRVNYKNQATNPEDRQFRAYSNSKYSYYDAENLAKLWGLASPWDAKLKMGRLLLKGNKSQIDSALQANRKSEEKHINAYSSSRYSYGDAENLAKLWGLSSPWDAKLKMGRLILQGKTAQINRALGKDSKKEDREIGAFGNSKYTYEDAKQLSYFWGLSSPWDAKLKIGKLILSGNGSQVKTALEAKKRETRQINTFWNSKYSYYDAETLAKFWGVRTTWDTKLKIGQKILNGKDAEVKKDLKDARSQ
ncbi:MAG: hypothetical protein AAF518_14220 [Spirochaetota bacterium]